MTEWIKQRYTTARAEFVVDMAGTVLEGPEVHLGKRVLRSKTTAHLFVHPDGTDLGKVEHWTLIGPSVITKLDRRPSARVKRSLKRGR